jgi:ribonuclease HIII
MADLVSKVENDIRRLRTALSSGNEEQVDRYLPSLQRSLLDDQSYLSIWDERLLAEASCLISRCCDEELRDERLNGLSQHLAAVRSIHDRLYAMLDPDIELGELLFLYLDKWPELLGESIGCRFDNTAKRKLHEARSSDNTEHGLENFLTTYFQHLRDQDLDSVVDVLQPSVELALEGYRRTHRWTVHGLFVTPRGSGEVRGLKICPEADGKGQINCLNRISPDMETVANKALACVRKLWSHARSWDFTWEIEGGEVAFIGDSIGLALTIGILAEVESFDVDIYTAFTGHVNWATGEVGRVEYLGAKLEAAKALGIRRVFIPRENIDEVDDIEGIEIVSVGSVGEAREWLQSGSYEHANTPLERLANARVRELEIELSAQGIRKVKHVQREEFCTRVVFSNYRDEVFVDIYHKKDLKPVVQIKHTDLRRIVQEECDGVFGAKPQEDESTKVGRLRRKYIVSSSTDQHRVEDYIFGRDDSIRESEQNCIYRTKIVRAHQTVFVRQYSSGTLTIDGPPGPLSEEVDGSIRAILRVPDAHSDGNDEHQIRLHAQIEAVEAVQLGEQWIGTDESGKGDYFGPLVGAAVLVDRRIAELLGEMGVKDSKRLSDKRVRELADQIHQVCDKRAVAVPIPPERYNALYAQFRKEGKNLNTLLAWAHTRALEDILSEFPQRRITVLVDKFADESYIQSKLLEKGRRTDLNLVQLPRAEANIAVAAASVLARAQFLQWLERLSRQYGVDLPKGASDPRIVQLGKQIVARYGQDGLAKVAKLHFKTTERILASE